MEEFDIRSGWGGFLGRPLQAPSLAPVLQRRRRQDTFSLLHYGELRGFLALVAANIPFHVPVELQRPALEACSEISCWLRAYKSSSTPVLT